MKKIEIKPRELTAKEIFNNGVIAERFRTKKEIDILGQRLLDEKKEEIKMAKRDSQIKYAKDFFTGVFYALEELKNKLKEPEKEEVKKDDC